MLRLALAAILYAFLTAVLLMLWRDLRWTVAAEGANRPQGKLVVLKSPDDGLAAGSVFLLQPVTLLGRAPTSTIQVPDAYASAQHALISWREGQWWLEDLGSRNGTLLNDQPLQSPAVIATGDIISVGQTQFRVELEYGPGTTGKNSTGNSSEPRAR